MAQLHSALVNNVVLLTALTAWLTAQLLEILTSCLKYHEFSG